MKTYLILKKKPLSSCVLLITKCFSQFSFQVNVFDLFQIRDGNTWQILTEDLHSSNNTNFSQTMSLNFFPKSILNKWDQIHFWKGFTRFTVTPLILNLPELPLKPCPLSISPRLCQNFPRNEYMMKLTDAQDNTDIWLIPFIYRST